MAHTSSTGRHNRAKEIEITRQMINAGAEAMADALDGVVSRGADLNRLWAVLVFRAMASEISDASISGSRIAPSIRLELGID